MRRPSAIASSSPFHCMLHPFPTPPRWLSYIALMSESYTVYWGKVRIPCLA
jgi:hypothetical protein